MNLSPSIHPYAIDTLARTRVVAPAASSPAIRLGNATLHALWHGWRHARRAGATLVLARRVARERRALAGLDAGALADIGLDPATARAEAGRRFLDLPRARLPRALPPRA